MHFFYSSLSPSSLTVFRAYTIHKTLQWYYRWIIDNTEDRIKELRKQKKRILDQVKETETYKVAKELLEKFDPSSEVTDSPGRSVGLNASIQRGKSDANQSLRLRNSISTPSNTPVKSMIGSPVQRMPSSLASAPFNPNNSQVQSNQASSFSPRPVRTFRPILPAERSSISRLIDVVVGDGPSNRYALICCYCHCHNGMALKDEFEYLAYRCCYCSAYNPPRKVRPSAPRIESAAVSSSNSDLVINQQETLSENNQLEAKSSETQAEQEAMDDLQCEEKSDEISDRGEECKSEHVTTTQQEESKEKSCDTAGADGEQIALTNET